MPPLRVTVALLHVTDRLVVESASSACADQRPLVLRLLVPERVARREERAELLAEETLAREPREERADRAAEYPLGDGRARRPLHHRPVQQQSAGEIHLERDLEVAGN